MSIFEDLIEELKEEHLLEETVIEVGREAREEALARDTASSETHSSVERTAAAELSPPQHAAPAFLGQAPALTEADFAAVPEFDFSAPGDESPAAAASGPKAAPDAGFEESVFRTVAASPRKNVNEKEYFRKRAMEEVTGLQMVEHVLSGVEREQMKIVPKPYDELPVKLALHDFMQVSQETKSSEHAQAEFRLMQETESWYSSLSHRDKQITVAHLRRFCEMTKPVLSSQALISLARFYRNSPYSEPVRSKFELILTRLFSREIEHDRREVLFSREELIIQIKELYADWSSIQLYSADEDDSDILITTLKFEDFWNEADEAQNFEELIGSDFFNRLRLFKESCHENFFAPLVTATSIESNIKIGNRYIELLEKERANSNSAALEEKYGFLYDQAISDATGKTLELVELLRQRTAESERNKPAEIVDIKVKAAAHTPYQPKKESRPSRFSGTTKWLLAAAVMTILACGGLYFWAEFQTQSIKASPSVKKVNLDNSSLKEFLQTARISDEIFYGITEASWENMNGEKKEELLKKILSIGGEKGFKKVHLLNPAGKTVGYASAEKTEVFNP
jgi:hypothetical protein